MKNKNFYYLITYAIIMNIIFFISLYYYNTYQHQPFIALFITIFMIMFHSNSRIIVGFIVPLFKNKIHVDKKIYKVSKKEFNFLSKLNIKKIKGSYFTYDKNQFKIFLDKENIEEVLKNNINAEFVHKLCLFVSLFSIICGYFLSSEELVIYIIAYILFGLFIDLIPILIQRYNRYRLLNLKNKFERINPIKEF